MTPCGAYTNRLESHFEAVEDMYGKIKDINYVRSVPRTELCPE